ncbi:ribosome biogenesis GTPase Der [Candidatus Falkowbacteria bacterium HGW-Falkowbacteria-2]|uniref:GTPase Der n=1 Tax=Candidatus Falkowbacteria bacterium HGW-Falkowbacteria-2 TaxID=2013769 RepID=A0A2N2E0V0_9BACT|nr:MAG: ribosome biogenesis GTPase Der [Candidatus Falkowbacteria bacterium HGW-Falkowbacteria-2]
MEYTPDNLPLVAICGRTNVGKSTLFNRLVEKRQALVSDIEGTTRDANFGVVHWNGKLFRLVDTAGLLDARIIGKKQEKTEDIDELAQQQALNYLNQAELLLFVVDGKAGLMPEDRQLAKALRNNPKYQKKTILIANKIDSGKQRTEAAAFNRLGLGEPITVSAQTGGGTGDMLEAVIGRIKSVKDVSGAVDPISEARLCIVGKPNVGKSSLLNSLLGYDRAIVSDKPHTTRESQDTELDYNGKLIRIIDTAGISRHGHKGKGLEKEGIAQSLMSLQRADIALLVLDISEGLTHQDAKMVEEIVDRHKSLIIIANKWDLIEEKNPKKWEESILGKLPFASWAPIVFVSAKTGSKVNKILDLALEVAEGRKTEVSPTQLKKFLSRVVKIHLPAKGKGLKAPHIFEIEQKRSNPPVFAIRIGSRDNLHFSYVRFLENRLREQYNFTGTPVRLRVTKNRRIHGVREA